MTVQMHTIQRGWICAVVQGPVLKVKHERALQQRFATTFMTQGSRTRKATKGAAEPCCSLAISQCTCIRCTHLNTAACLPYLFPCTCMRNMAVMWWRSRLWGFDTRSRKPGVSGLSLALQWTKDRFNNETSGGKGSHITEWHAQLSDNFFIQKKVSQGISEIWYLIFDIWEKAIQLVLKNDDKHAEGGNCTLSVEVDQNPLWLELYFNELTFLK